MLAYRFFSIRLPRILLPLVVLVALCCSFFAGHYIGRYDAESHQAAAFRIAQAAESANSLKLFGSAAVLMRQSKYDQATRLLEQLASLQVPETNKCLSSKQCSWLAAPTPEAREALQRLVSEYGVEQGKSQ